MLAESLQELSKSKEEVGRLVKNERAGEAGKEARLQMRRLRERKGKAKGALFL